MMGRKTRRAPQLQRPSQPPQPQPQPQQQSQREQQQAHAQPQPQPQPPAQPAPQPKTHAAPMSQRERTEPRRPPEAPRPAPRLEESRRLVNIGKSIHIKGELTGNEDLTIDGTVEGKIVLSDHSLTIGANARINAQVSATSVIVIGNVVGDIRAQEKIEVKDGGTVDGDLIAPRVILAEGARFRGSIDMLSATDPGTDTKSKSRSEPESDHTAPIASAPSPAAWAFEDDLDDDIDDLTDDEVEDIAEDLIEIDEVFEERPAWAGDDDDHGYKYHKASHADPETPDDHHGHEGEDGKHANADPWHEEATEKGGDQNPKSPDKLADIFDELDP